MRASRNDAMPKVMTIAVRTSACGSGSLISSGSAMPTMGASPVGPPAEMILSTPTEDIDRAVPRGLRLAASWSWRVILVSALIYGVARVAGYLSEVVIPLAIAILLAAMLSPVASRLRGWGLHRGPATAVIASSSARKALGWTTGMP